MDGNRGPCEQCTHFRSGNSIAFEAFEALPDTGHIKAMLRAAQNQKRREERAQAGGFLEERELNEKSRQERYSHRPTEEDYQYCGVDEFAGKFYCSEVKNRKNPNYECDQFKESIAAHRAQHSCKTCSYNYRPYDQLVETLVQQVVGSGPKSNLAEFKGEIEQFLQSTAENDYEECIDGDGLLRTRPGLLPICETWSSGNSYVVGPVANTAERCSQWVPGPNERARQVSSSLSALVARCEQAYQQYEENFARYDQRAWELRTVVQTEVGHAKADLIEFCLLFLGANPEFAKSVAARYSHQIWEPAHGKGAPWGSKRDMWLALLAGTAPSHSAPTAREPAMDAPAPSPRKGGTRAQALRQLLPGLWQCHITFLGKSEAQQLMFRTDGTCQVGGHQEGTWDVSHNGKLTFKWAKNSGIAQFSEVEPRRLTGTIRLGGSILKGKTVWNKTAG